MNRGKKSSATQLLGMIAVSVALQMIALVKSGVLAANFGAGVELDAYHFNNNLTTFITSFVASGVTTVVLPAYVRNGKRKNVDAFLTGVFLAVAVLFGALFVFHQPIVKVISGKEGEFLAYSDRLMLLTMLTQSATAVTSVTAAYYQAKDKFVVPKLISLGVNAVSLLVLTQMRNFDIYQYVQLICVMGIVHLVVDAAIAMKLGFRFTFQFNWRSAETKEMFRVFLPTVISSGVYKIHVLVDTGITSSLAAGSLTILSYSNQIVTAVNSLIIGNLLLFAYPRIVQAVSRSKAVGMNVTSRYARVFHLLIGGLVAGFFAVGEDVIMILFGRGRFDADAVRHVFLCTAIYLFGQQFNIARDLIYRFHYANKDTVTTLRNSLCVSILNIVLSLILVKHLHIFGVVLGTVLSSFWSLVNISRITRNKYEGKKWFRNLAIEYSKVVAAVLISILGVYAVKQSVSIGNIWLDVMCFGVLSVILYCAALLILKVGAMKELTGRIAKRA